MAQHGGDVLGVDGDGSVDKASRSQPILQPSSSDTDDPDPPSAATADEVPYPALPTSASTTDSGGDGDYDRLTTRDGALDNNQGDSTYV